MTVEADFREAFKQCSLVGILRGVTPDEVEQIGDALVDAGFTIIEVPLNSPDAYTSISKLVRRFGGKAIIGAGTVISVEQVVKVADAGGRLVVSPNTDIEVIRATTSADMISVPGYYTASEAFDAIKAGAHALKLFPAEVAGIATVKSHRAVLPGDIPLVASGGITPNTIAAWCDAGVDGFGLGSALYTAGLSARDVAQQAARFVAALPLK